ncbi:MAG TPA: hypothetical protein ENI51_08650 [Candidatus Atribacteria bacterium]|nr:hypothetical protein [Candidatus Atribacteria bacterium]
MDEYEQLQRLRELWSRAIMTWGQIFIPLGAAIIAFFVTQLLDFANRGWATPFLFIGWTLFSLCMIYWRWIVHQIDRQIVGMYPRMLELEKERKMETQAAYYYRNLNKKSIKYLANKLEIPFEELKNKDFREFKRKVAQKGDNPYDFLLDVWDKFLYDSVTSRGHSFQDWVVGILIVVLLITIIVGSKLGWFSYVS